jgi:hypothetical protein
MTYSENLMTTREFTRERESRVYSKYVNNNLHKKMGGGATNGTRSEKQSVCALCSVATLYEVS